MFVLPVNRAHEHQNRRESSRREMLEDLIHPLAVLNSLLETPEYCNKMRNRNGVLQQQQPIASEVTIDKDKFQASFDVQHFKPEEVVVKITGDNAITVEAKHEERQDEHGRIFRHFVRKYVLPKNCDAARLESRLSSDGVLSITAPTVGDKAEPKSIPIQVTGKPVKLAEEKQTESVADKPASQ
ncbi:unnamed protein product [Phyllotreta striolata]|uniref:SHSP domain-containing protein n=1 Tax=Phyllotreta striolata TaxID=444603 RepID=A0A9N9THU1_PHYSR|nr:unnamed protein product [Phyllotreta striolata]